MTEGPPVPPSAAGSEIPDLVSLREALASEKDDHLRLAADFDNYRKRTRRDSEQQASAEKEAFIRDLLPVLDNLERALASEPSVASGLLYQGVAMTVQQLRQLLLHHGIEADEDVGRPFDPHQHEAVSLGCDPSQPDQVILEVIQRGYRHGNKVFRPAKVIVNDPSLALGGGVRAR